MSPIRHTGRHRKPRRSRAAKLFHGGVLSGVLSTVAVSAPAQAGDAKPPEEPPAETTGELRALQGLFTVSSAQAAEATERYVATAELQRAHAKALHEAEETAAERKAEEEAAEAQAEAEAAAQAAREAESEEAAASRSAERSTTLSAQSEPDGADDAAEAAGGAAAEAPATGSGSAIVDFARGQIGSAYQLGATGPGAWDCSGLTQAAYAAAGVSLPRTSQEQSTAGTQIPVSEAQPGDLLYWGGAGSAHHVAVYVGDGRFVGAQNPSTGVVEQDLSWSEPSGAVRIG